MTSHVRFVSEPEFREAICAVLSDVSGFDFVTGPGRSGAVASVYASHYLGIPFVPFKRQKGANIMIVDTAINTGRTIRKASNFYHGAPYFFAFTQPPRVKFWYERLSCVRGKGNEYRLTEPQFQRDAERYSERTKQ